MRSRFTDACKLGVLAALCLAMAGPARAETLEIVTYYPAPSSSSNDLYGRSLRVGTAYQNTPPPADGDALIDGSLGIGTTTLAHALNIGSAPFWTSDGWRGAIALPNISAIGWAANVAGQRMGMGHTTGGFGIFRTLADPGTTAQPSVYDFFINDAGRVGIGYNAPISTVHIRATKFGASNFAGVFLQGLNPTDAPGIYFSNSANTLSGVIGMAPQRGEYSNDAQAGDTVLAGNRLLLATTTGPSQTPARLTIANDGLVGVGTTAPVTALDVVSNTIFRRTTAVTGVNDLILFSPLDGNVGMELQSGSTGGTPFLDFSNDTVSTFDARLILEQNDVLRLIGAALGIEGVPPATILGWRGNIYRPKLWVQNSDINESRWPAMVIAGDIGLIQFVNSSLSPMADIGTFNSTFSIANRRGGAPITFWTTPSGAGGTPTERLRLLPNGDLVVGAPAVLAPPAAPNGQPGNLSANDIFLRASNRWLSAPSDVRLKDGIATIPNALDRVVQLRGVNFRWKEPRKGESGVRMGVIAQEVEPVFPELVSVSPDGVRYVAYPEMSGALIEAIKELKAQNDALAERVEALEEELSAVKAASGPASE